MDRLNQQRSGHVRPPRDTKILATRTALPIAMCIYPENNSDPAAYVRFADKIDALSGARNLDLVGVQGMITTGHIKV